MQKFLINVLCIVLKNVHSLIVAYRAATQSKLVLLAKQQVSKWRDELLGQEITTLSRNPANQEDVRLVSKTTILLKKKKKEPSC